MQEKRRYPARTRRELMISDVEAGKKVWIAGRLTAGGLQDASGTMELEWNGEEHPTEGNLVEVQGERQRGGRFSVVQWALLAPGRSSPPVGSRNGALWNLPRNLFDRRRTMKDALRHYFLERGFLEVETPVMVRAPGQEPHLDPFRTLLDDGRGGSERFLITSPEYHHKRLLAAGYEKIFEVARVFRNGPSELRGLHHHEFSMVEWYRAYASYLEIMEDVESLIHSMAPEVAPPFERLSMREAFQRHAGLDLEPFFQSDAGFGGMKWGIEENDDLETRFFKIFIAAVEPKLGWDRPCLLIDFPAAQASLSKVKEEDPSVCERFELYIRGVELANGFTELNDPEEQRRRFEEEARTREGPPVPIDEAFLEALDVGMPPSGGVALGFDRLLMVLFNEKKLGPVTPYMD